MSDRATFGIKIVRAAAKKRADATSLHAIADEIGMSYTGLRGFLAGGKPHPRTREKLVAWYALQRSGAAAETPAKQDIDAAISLLALALQGEGIAVERERKFAEILSRLASAGGVERR